MKIEINPHFIDYITNWDYYEYFLLGGYGSSKSFNTAVKLLLKALSEKRKILIVRDVFNTLKDSCYEDIIEASEFAGMRKRIFPTKSPLEIKTVNGSKFLFRGLDNPNKLKSIKDIDIVWIEEGEGTKKSYEELKARLRKANSKLHIITTSNPKPKRHWIYQRYIMDLGVNENDFYSQKIIKKDDCYLHHSTYKDNKFLNDKFIKDMESLKDPLSIRIKKLGMFGSEGQKVFSNISRINHNAIIDKLKLISWNDKYNGMDFGFSVSYNALLNMAVERNGVGNNLIIFNEYYKKGMTDTQTIQDQEFKKAIQGHILSDSAEPKTIQFYNENGISMAGVKKDRIVTGIQKLRNFDNIFISDKCINTWREFDSLQYQEDRYGDIIEDKFNIDPHTKDACVYGLNNYSHNNMFMGISGKPVRYSKK